MMQLDMQDRYFRHGCSNRNPRLGPGLYARARLQFVRKVYSILSIQLLITVAMTYASMYVEEFRQFQLDYEEVTYVMIVLLIVSEIAILCCPEGR